MLDNLIQQFISFSHLSEEDFIPYLSVYEYKQYKKGEIVLQNGDWCKNVYFIINGLVRCYNETQQKDITLDILKEGEYFTDYLSFSLQKQTPYNFQALEDTDLVSISYNNIELMKEKNKDFAKIARLILEWNYAEILAFYNSIKIRTPKERYLFYLESRGDICHRAPLMHIASMLNMNQSTLSRIRTELANQESISN